MSKKDRRLFRPWLLSVGLFVALTGLMQYALLPNVAYLAAHNWDDHYYRLVGVFLDPGFTGAILCLSLFLCLDYFFRSTRLGVLAAVTILYTALALTYSRASYLMYLVALIVLTLWRKSVKIFVIGAVLLLITVYVLPHNSSEGTHLARENSVLARLHNWQHSIVIWQKAPIFGVGFDAYRYTQPVNINSHAGAGADSSLLLVLAATGIIGFLCYVNLVRKMLSIGRNDWLFIASFLAILVHSFFNNTLFYPWVMEWLWILLATTNESS